MKEKKELQVAVLFGCYMREELDFPYYLAEEIVLGFYNKERSSFIELFTGKEYVNTSKCAEYGLTTGFNLVSDFKNFNEERTKKDKDGNEVKTFTKKLDVSKCTEYYDFLEKLVFLYSEDKTFIGVEKEEFEKEFDVHMNIVFVKDENAIIDRILNGTVEPEELDDLIDSYNEENSASRAEDIEKKMVESLNKPINEVISKIKESIINQDEAIKKIVIAIYKYVLFGNDMKSNILIYGPSGCGKTALINEISKLIDVPVNVENMTSYTASGFQGASVEDILLHIYRNADEDLARAERSILFLDEIDKKASKDAQSDIANGDVLKALLKIIEGGEFEIQTNPMFGDTIKFDTSKLLVIAGGAFTDLYNQKASEKKNSVGFGNNVTSISNEVKYGTELTIKDFEKFGMPLEFMGRFKTIIRMNTLSLENLVDIIKNSNLSEMKKYLSKLENMGIKVTIPDSVYERIAKLAHSYGTGARGLNIVVDNVFENVLYEIFNGIKDVEEVSLGENIVQNKEDFTLKKRLM